ncbi:MAG TPA: TolC family outer membrane protein [Gammaproteobacteria bacterium]|nr:TolC family outer membrane protein [Gammaproteobacteria bacterium]
MSRLLSFSKTLCILTLSLVCSLTYAEDLEATYELALQTDAILQQAWDNELAVLELRPQARADLLPLIGLTWNSTYSNTNNPLLERYNTWLYGATLTAPIINLQTWFQYRQTDDEIKSAVATYQDTRQDLMVRVATQYFAILSALEDLLFARSERIAFARQLEETKQKFTAGVIAITDVNVAQARYDNAIAQEIAAINALHDQQEIMGEITGVPAKNVNILKYNITLHKPHPDDIDYWVKTTITTNYDLQSKRYDIAAAKKNISIQRAGHYPTLTANGASNVSRSVPPDPEISNTNTIGLTLNLPLFNSGKVISQTRQAAAEYDTAKQKEIQAERTAISNVRQAYRGVLTQISQVKALQQSVISNKSALDATSAAFQVGTRTIVDVLNSQSDLDQAQTDLEKAKYNYILESLKLKRYAGIIQDSDIQIVNTWLQPPPKDMYPPKDSN